MVRLLPGHRPAGHLVVPVAVGFVLGSFFSFLTLTHHYSTPSNTPSRCHNHPSSGQRACIPPIVHFIQLKKDKSSDLHFSFESFLALYSAYLFIRPSVIYIHTDHTPKEITDAAQHGSSWTKRVLTAFPDAVRLNQVTAPTRANSLEIKRIEHKSDFVRLDQLALHGGIYLDWDVLTLRSVDPLLESGFRAVVGRQSDATVNNGIILAARDSAVVRVMRRETPRRFTGGWVEHSVNLITEVAQALAGVGGEVLIMDRGAFAPFTWTQESVNAALARHEREPVAARELDSLADRGMSAAAAAAADPMAVWERHRVRDKKVWARDYNDAFFFHKIFNDVESPRGYNGVSVPYILARDSNYALAAWPIVVQGIKDGYIDEHDASV